MTTAPTPASHTLAPFPERRAWCADHDHPGHTFNPWLGATWCLCGAVRRPDDEVLWPKPTDCGGDLVRCNHH